MHNLNSFQEMRQLIREFTQQNGTPEQLARMPLHANGSER
jgi:hypothetical protein